MGVGLINKSRGNIKIKIAKEQLQTAACVCVFLCFCICIGVFVAAWEVMIRSQKNNCEQLPVRQV